MTLDDILAVLERDGTRHLTQSCSEREMDALERALGRRLPNAFRVLLSRVGCGILYDRHELFGALQLDGPRHPLIHWLVRWLTATRRRAYALLATLLSTGAPLGLVGLRALRAGGVSLDWLRDELQADRGTYIYVTLATTIVFLLLSYALGRQADRLAELALTDALTGLCNMRAFQQRLDEELARARRYGHPLSLLMIDVDRLKEINDRAGHEAGSAALVRVADALRHTARATDVTARWGGDEFAMLAPDTPAEAAVRLGERIRSLVAESAGPTGERVTVSVGLATTDGRDGDLATVLRERADAALYSAKRQGRNQVVRG